MWRKYVVTVIKLSAKKVKVSDAICNFNISYRCIPHSAGGTVGLHVFWDCPALQGYCQNIKGEVERILNSTIPMDPMLFLLGVPPENGTGKDQRYILHVAYSYRLLGKS